jgi:hypothetical protein
MESTMFITAETEITIQSTAQAAWNYASAPENWTASNPEEHYGLQYNSPGNRPATGVTFHQQESVAGVYADLHGRFPYVDSPYTAVWAGIASYRLLGGLLRVRIPEGGVIRLEETEEGVHMSHDVYMQFPRSLWGRMWLWFFKQRNAAQAVYDHTYRELVFFREQLEAETRHARMERAAA